MLEAKGLSKVYAGGIPALDALDLSVSPGEVYCLLGPNGAGKTTTINLFLNFIAPTSGVAQVCGIDVTQQPAEARRKLGYIPESVMLYGKLTGLENLDFFTALALKVKLKKEVLMNLLVKAGLPAEAAMRRVETYSKGMRQKVGIAIALAKQAEVLLLDEPTSGLDPLAANEFTRLIDGLRQDGMAILMVTHDLFLAQQCGTRVGIMQRGRLVSTLDTAATDPLGLERAYLQASRLLEAAS